MKKGTIASLVVGVALVASLGALVGCSVTTSGESTTTTTVTTSDGQTTTTTTTTTTISNPMTEVSSASDLESQAGVKMNVDTLTWKNIKYFVYDLSGTKMAEVQFDSMGYSCAYRGEASTDKTIDISGIEGTPDETSTHAVKNSDIEGQTINLKFFDGEPCYAVASWYDNLNGAAYSISIESDDEDDSALLMDDAYTLALTCMS